VELKLDAAKWRARRGVGAVLDAVGGENGLSRYVGGAVRDSLLRLPFTDVDLATRLRPHEVVERLQRASIKAVPTGIAHGTITAVADGRPIEITTLRRDVSTDGRRATVAFTDDWKEDAARRDFTINALFADPRTGEVFDYFGGLADLEERRVRFIGEPLERIAEDHLRILRYFRFHARFGSDDPDAAALDACTARANDLMALSRERIADELLKILALPDPAPTIGIMLQRGILKPVLPEIEPERLCELEALVLAERSAGFEPESVRRLAALLPPDPELADQVAVRLKLSNKLRKRLSTAAAPITGGSPEALTYRIGPDSAQDQLLLASRFADARAVAGWTPPRLPIGGGALIARGLPEGPIVATTLRQIEQQWVNAGFPTDAAFDGIVESAIAAAKAQLS
jgi:poly(A) polymerase